MTARSRSWTLLAASAWLALVTGCGAPAVDGSDPASDEVASTELAVESPWDQPTCSEAALKSPSEQCVGPWTYQKTVTVDSRDRFCGGRDDKKDCTLHQDQRKWKHGIDPTLVESFDNPTETFTTSCTARCRWDEPDICGTTTCTGDQAAWGARLAAKKLDDLDDPLKTAIQNDVPYAGDNIRDLALSKLVVGHAETSTPGQTFLGPISGGRRDITKTKIWKTKLTIRTPQAIKMRSLHSDCETFEYPSCPHPTSSKIQQYSPIRSSRPSILLSPLYPGDAVELVSDQVCLTCDQMPFSNPAEVLAKANCLFDKMAAPHPGADAEWRRAFVSRLKLLFMLRADMLRDSTGKPLQRHKDIVQLYATDEETEAACHQALGLSAQCQAEAASAQILPRLQLCKNLSTTNANGQVIPLAVISSELDYCLGALDDSRLAASADCRSEVQTVAAEITRALMGRKMEVITAIPANVGSHAIFTGLTDSLGAIDRWYDHAKVAAAGDTTWLAGEQSAVVDLMWKRTYGLSAEIPDPINSGNVANVMLLVDGSSLDADFSIIFAAFASGSTFDSPPLLGILGNALRGSIEKLETVSDLHDLACRYRPCSPTTQTSQIWKILAALPDETALDEALDAATSLNVQHPDIYNALRAVQLRHANLRKAYTAAGGQNLTDLYFTDVPPIDAAPLGDIIRLADLRRVLFEGSGLFFGERPLELHAGMQNKQLVIDQLAGHVSVLHGAYQDFLGRRVELVEKLIHQIGQGANQDSLVARLAEISERQAVATGEKIGLQMREDSERRAWSNYVEAFDRMRKQGVFDSQSAADVKQLTTLSVKAASARFAPRANPQTPAELSLIYTNDEGQQVAWEQVMNKGQQLRFTVTGQWAPSCGIQTTDAIKGPTGDKKISKADALTGPEGYMTQWGGSQFEAESWSDENAQKYFANIQLCFKNGWGSPGFIETAFGQDAELYILACAGADFSHSHSHSNSSGNDNRTSSSFQAGMHLDNVPFTDAPAGALLLVAVSRTNPRDIKDVQVVNRQSVYMAPEDVFVYLIPNDLNPASAYANQHGGCVAKPDALTVEITKTTPFGAVAIGLANAMAGTLSQIESQSEAILAQGDLVQGEEATLRAFANQKITDETGLLVTNLPHGVQEFFEGFLSAEIVSLKRRAQIHRHEIEIKLSEMQRKALYDELAAGGTQSQLLAIIPRLLMRQLQASQLGLEQAAVIRALREDIPPIFELRFLSTLKKLTVATQNPAAYLAIAQLNALENLDFAAPADDITAKVLAFAAKVKLALEDAVANQSDYGTVRMAVAFPNPASYVKANDPPDCGRFGTCRNAGPPNTTFHPVEITRAEQVWNAFKKATPTSPFGKAKFIIKPEDVYSVAGFPGGLICGDSAPVIRKMAIYAVNGNSLDPGPMSYRPAVQASNELTFPTAAGTPIWTKTDDDWLFTGIPLLGGAEGEAVDDLIAYNTQALSGLSPFSAFEVNFAGWPSALDINLFTQLVVVFELDTRPIAAPGVAVDSCR